MKADFICIVIIGACYIFASMLVFELILTTAGR